MGICLSVVAALASVVGGIQHETAPAPKSFSKLTWQKECSLEGVNQHRLQQAVEEADAGPDPFFEDLIYRDFSEDERSEADDATASTTVSNRTYVVEVYENEFRGIDRRWRELRSALPLSNRRWTYQDGSTALPPSEIRPPDEWDWVSEWKIDRSGGRDVGGWEYMKEMDNFSSKRQTAYGQIQAAALDTRNAPATGITATGERLKTENQGIDPPWGKQETNRVSLELDDQHGVATGKGAPGLLVYAHDETEGLGFDLGKGTDVDLLPAPDLGKLGDPLRTPLSVLSFGNAVTAVKGWWADEFTFRGFGIGITKPIFRGMLLRPDVGLGVRLPLTLHFRSWERQVALPAISSSFFVLWPPAVQVSHAVSYPAELLQEWTTAAVRKIMVSSKEAAQARQRKETVQRVGFTVGVRYSATYGMQWWLSPYFFLLPGIRLISDMYESFMALLLSVMALNQRSNDSETVKEDAIDEKERELSLWILALRNWAATKTSGLGYALYLSGNRLGGGILINFMPFFLPTFSMNRSSSGMVREIDGDAKDEGDVTRTLEPEIDPVSSTPIRGAPSSTVGMEAFDEAEADLDTSERGRQRQEGEVLEACAA